MTAGRPKKKDYKCKHCGETDKSKFYEYNKSSCAKCLGKRSQNSYKSPPGRMTEEDIKEATKDLGEIMRGELDLRRQEHYG